MSLRDQIRNSLQKNEKQRKSGTWHSKAYHRFFAGYSEVSVPRSNGKGSIIQRVYTGNYYRQDLTKGQRFQIRILYIVFFLCIAYLFGSSAVLPLASNSTWYVVISQAVSIPFLFWILIAFISYMSGGRDLTMDGYRSSSLALKKATLGAAISLGSVALATLIFMFLNFSNEPLTVLLCAAKYLVGGALALIMNRMENKIKYLIIPSQNTPPVDATLID